MKHKNVEICFRSVRWSFNKRIQQVRDGSQTCTCISEGETMMPAKDQAGIPWVVTMVTVTPRLLITRLQSIFTRNLMLPNKLFFWTFLNILKLIRHLSLLLAYSTFFFLKNLSFFFFYLDVVLHLQVYRLADLFKT